MDEQSLKTIEYFRNNLLESFYAYNAWKTIFGSKCKGIVSEDLAKRYVQIQNYHSSFFTITERSLLLAYVVLVMHAFDTNKDSLSLFKLDRKLTEEFISKNQDIINTLKDLRHNLFAHKSKNIKTTELLVPSMIDSDRLFDNLFIFYNSLTSKRDSSSTSFDHAMDVKIDIENLFKNIERGENVKRKEIEITWELDENKGKISDVI